MNGSTLIYATLGDPIAQIQTPIIVPPILEQRGVNATWIPLHVPTGQLAPVMDGLRRIPNFGGCTVTVPHKQAMLALCDETTERARASGGVNLVRREADGRLVGDMVDGVGFVRGLERGGHHLTGKTAWIVGAGGAGAAIAIALAEAKVGAVAITDADAERAAQVCARVKAFAPDAHVSDVAAAPAQVDYAINATPAGMAPNDPQPFDVDLLPPDCTVCDVIMKPAETRLLAAARARGLKVQAGRPMLDEQIDLYLRFLHLEGAAS